MRLLSRASATDGRSMFWSTAPTRQQAGRRPIGQIRVNPVHSEGLIGPFDTVPAPAEWRYPVRTLARLANDTIPRLASASLPPSTDVAVAREVALGVARKISLMPVHVSFVVLTLTCGFALTAWLRTGRRMARIPDAVIRRQIASWSSSPLPLVGDAMLLYGRLARFQYHSRQEMPGVDG